MNKDGIAIQSILDLFMKNDEEISGEDIEKKKKEDSVFVNTSRLYLKKMQITSEADKMQNEEVLEIINRAIESTVDERQMFVEMTVHDIKSCFKNELKDLPVNSFKKCKKMSIKEMC